MIEAVRRIGEYAFEKKGISLDNSIDLLSILIQDPASSKAYKHILAIKLNKRENGFEFADIDLEDYSKSKIVQYLYRRGSGNGPDITPTSRVTEIEKTFVKNKILPWFQKTLRDETLNLEDEELEFLRGINDCLSENKDLILSKLKVLSEEIPRDENSIITIVIEDNGKRYIGDYSVFREILKTRALSGYYQKYNKESKSEDKICSICKRQKDEVYGFVSTYKFYTVDKPGSVSGGFDQSLAWKNYPVCQMCALTLEEGKKYLEDFSSFRFYGFDYYLIPKPLIVEKSDEVYRILEDFKGVNPEFKKGYIHLLDDTEDEILELISEQKNFFNNNLLIYEESPREFKILLYIEDVLPSRLRKLFDVKKELDGIAVFKNCRVSVFENGKKQVKSHLEFNFGNIWHFFGRTRERDMSKYFLDITNRILTNRKIDYSFLMWGIMENIKRQFINNFSTEESSLRGFQLLLYLRRLNLLENFDRGSYMNEKRISDIFGSGDATDRVKQAEHLFEEFSDFFNNDAKKAIFMEGVLAQRLLNIQYHDRGSTPFRSKLQGLKLDEKVIKGLLPQIQNKLEEYGKNYYTDLEGLISKYMIEAGDGWRMSKDEIGFYFVLGMNLSYLFKSKKEEETNGGGNANE
ncbi:MAG: CRISPR-associated protein, family [Candidatus Syntrophoarchaeum caldarius]|uniref:CRISPR-associated protein, family n=1 Tax=Candidatus Syntropharchaeum caldarium TaxID=1838285 RepID=A0A1F2P9L6_9EURY|nr:MAG: CRISPR-associated protein, family [Candidatus Syntrophoarchaeum caldarius]